MQGSSLSPMLEARSVAVIGASARPDSIGQQIMLQLTRGGFDGDVYPVNPRYQDILGHRCFPSLADLPQSVDLAIIAVANRSLEEQLRAAAVAGARSAVIFASCYEPPAEGNPSLAERLAIIARDVGMAICGGNGMGFVNIERHLRACGFFEPLDLQPGGVCFISHSGSAFSALLHNDRGLRFNLAVSPGLELVTTATAYMEYALDLPSTRVLALFIETTRDPARFRAALAVAAERDIPVVALKVGREPQARDLVAAHSGALAGEDAAYDALFDAHGVLRVRTMDEMADTVELLSAGRRAGPGGLASIHDSGGERAHLIDAAAAEGVPFAAISEATRARLTAVLDEGLPAVNPLDAWGTGNESEEIFAACIDALLDDPDTAALAFCVDLTTEEITGTGYDRVATEAFARTDKPMALLGNMTSAIDRRDAAFVRAAGVPVLEGTATGLRAFGHLFALRDFRARPAVADSSPVSPGRREAWRQRLAAGEAFDEPAALALLAEYGIPVIAHAAASDAPAAVAAAERIGWPVALKTAVSGIEHKSDVGGVVLDIADADALRTAYADLAARVGPEVTVAAMARPGVELHFGVTNDAQFGPLVVAAAGGLLVEVVSDRAVAVPPLDRARARGLLDRLRVRPLLDGVRGSPHADVGALAEALAALSWLAHDLGDLIAALDVNPVIAGPNGCVAVDALVIPARGSA